MNRKTKRALAVAITAALIVALAAIAPGLVLYIYVTKVSCTATTL